MYVTTLCARRPLVCTTGVVFLGWKGESLSESSKVGPPAAHVIETEIDGDISLYNPSNEQVTVLNGPASDVWALCDGEHTVEEITHLLASSYGTTEAAISDDIEHTVASFQKAGLLQT